jgi:hypothetical protein
MATLNQNATGQTFQSRGLRNAMVVGSVVGALFLISLRIFIAALDGATGGPSWLEILFYGFLLAPILVSFRLLSALSDNKLLARGAGISCGYFGGLVLVSPLLALLFFGGLLMNLKPLSPGLRAGVPTILCFFAVVLIIAIRIAWMSVRVGKSAWGVFRWAANITALYLLVGSGTILSMQQNAQRQEQTKVGGAKELATQQRNVATFVAHQRLTSLTACLLRFHLLHPQAPYPNSLDAPPATWDCEVKFGAEAVPEFLFTYTASGTDFQLTAIPKQKGITFRDPLFSDARGIVFVYSAWSNANVRARVMVMPRGMEDSQLEVFKMEIEKFTKTKGGGQAPTALAKSMLYSGLSEPEISEDGAKLNERCYEVTYLPPTVQQPSRFALSARCESYGQECLRSYFANYDGTIHATGEPRPATPQDPLALACESSVTTCQGVDWSVP